MSAVALKPEPARRPTKGDRYVRSSDATGDHYRTVVGKNVRQTDDGLWTVVDEYGLAWIRFDARRGQWVHATCRADGGEVPA